MKIGVPKEICPGETRVASTPEVVKKLVKTGFQVLIEANAGTASHYPDDQYREAGATIIKLNMSYWNVGLIMHYPGEAELRVGESVGEWAKSCSTEGFQAVGSVVTSDPAKSRDGSTWSFRVDPDQPDVMYATWTLKNGKKRLEEVRFKKLKK